MLWRVRTARPVSRWTAVALGELLRVLHGFAFKGEFFAAEESGSHVLLTPKNFRRHGGLDLSEGRRKYYTGPIDEKFVLRQGDIVMALTDLKNEAPILGAVGVVPVAGRYLHNQRIGKVVVDRPDRLATDFVPWLLNSPRVRARVRSSATGATVRHTAPVRISEILAPLPDLGTQKKIAAVLSAFDELIEINERRMVLFEALARRLYREWFVRFRFPGHEDMKFVDSELGRMPEGWEVRRLGEIAQVVVDGVNPTEVHSGAPYLGLEHMPRRETTLREWGSIESVTSRKLRFSRGDTLFGKIRPYFHKVVWAPFAGVASSDAIVIRPLESLAATALVNAVGSSDALVAHAVATSNGTKMPRADSKALLAFPMALPELSDGLVARFEQAAGHHLETAAALVRHNRALAATRDLLLPRLVTGRLDISDADLGDLLPALSLIHI